MIKLGFLNIKAVVALIFMLATSAVFTSCSKDEPAPEPTPKWPIEDIIGTYISDYDKWDLDAVSKFYPTLEDGSFDYDNIISAKEYCEAFAKDYNAAENPATPVTAEDCSYNLYNIDTHYVVFEITENIFKMTRCYVIAEGVLELYDIEGEYEYDIFKGELLVHSVAIADQPEDVIIKISDLVKGESIDITITDYYWWSVTSYDRSIDYLPFCTTTYYNKM